jgi:hypothetical protein
MIFAYPEGVHADWAFRDHRRTLRAFYLTGIFADAIPVAPCREGGAAIDWLVEQPSTFSSQRRKMRSRSPT